MTPYRKKASDKVETAMHKKKQDTLKSGGSGKKVTSRKQVIAIGLSEARNEGDNVPARRGAAIKNATTRKTPAKSAGAKKPTGKKTSARKTAARKSSAKKSS